LRATETTERGAVENPRGLQALAQAPLEIAHGAGVARFEPAAGTEVEIADGVRVRQVRSMITGVRAKGEPVKDDAKG